MIQNDLHINCSSSRRNSVFCWICLRPLSRPSRFQEDFEFDGQAQFQDPRSTSESTTPMEGENMGGWWPEHSTPDTGVRPARQRPLACTWSSAHSSGKCSFNAPNLFLLLLLPECWFVAVGWFCLYFFNPPVLWMESLGCLYWDIVLDKLGLTHLMCIKITLGPRPLRVWHSFIGFCFHQFTVFSLDTCMLVELASVCWDCSTEFFCDHINVGGTTSSVVSFVCFFLFCSTVCMFCFSSFPY